MMKFTSRYQNSQHKQKGVALVSVLLAIALCVILATEILTEQKFQVQRVQNILERQQAYWYAISSENFVKALLKRTAEKDKGVFNLDQPWAISGMSFPVDDGLIEGEIKDLSSCFNLNSLYYPDIADDEKKARLELFVRLLSNLDITAEVSHEDLAVNLFDWLDKDDYPSGAVGYDGDMYTGLAFPYLSANSNLAHENELRVIYGFDVMVMTQLKDKVCVIPNNNQLQINVNTIDAENPEYLMAMLDIDRAKVDDILSNRPDDGFNDIAEFFALKEVSSLANIAQLDKSQFTVNSNFFKLITNAYFNDIKFDLTSVFQLDNNYNVNVITRRFGGRIERKANPETE
ncbi:type II secretion system minor pseudopilin GspK [Psychrosphaera sp. F3M07]|uniref:type II secretion system minor pseudopilin GspK n=1 Tax=Psychrosphaera sp. F3M07 TaxID=2841560 RepID=UPI001C0A3725|nr:type II secretion system minor pseudopilin GspK [Psychrosphaera sp. F3M07]MBU2918173.1 type II secretion system minor pseudopilin GspK [Psychrosphaera sp. F3M07]